MLPTDRELWELLLKVIRVDSPPSIIGDLLQKMPNYLQVLETSLDNGPTTSTDSKVPQHEQQPTLRDYVTHVVSRLVALCAQGGSRTVLHAPALINLERIFLIVLKRHPIMAKQVINLVLTLWTRIHIESQRFFQPDPPQWLEFEVGPEKLLLFGPEDAERLQINLTHLAAKISEALIASSPRTSTLFWTMLVEQLTLGELPLKTASLRLYHALLMIEDVPMLMTESQKAFDVLFSLIRFMTGSSVLAMPESERSNVQHGLDLCLLEWMQIPLNGAIQNQFVDEIIFLWHGFLKHDDLNELMRLEEDLQHTLYECLAYALTRISQSATDRSASSSSPSLPLKSTDYERSLVFSVSELAPLLKWELPSCNVLACHIAFEVFVSRQVQGNVLHGQSLENVFKQSPTWKKIHEMVESQESTGCLTFSHIQWTCDIASKILANMEDNHPKQYLDFLSRDIKDVFIETALEKIIQKPSDSSVFHSSLSIVYKLQYFQPLETFSQQQLLKIAAICTLPWMDGQLKLLDLRIGDARSQNLIQISPQVKRQILEESKSLAIQCLSLLPKQVAPNWRTLALKLAWKDQDPILCRAIIENIPLFAHQMGPNVFAFIQDLVEETINFSDDRKICIPLLAKIAGLLVCTHSKLTQLKRSKGEILVRCMRCDKGQALNPSPSGNVTLADVTHLLKLVGHEDVNVKTFVLSLIKPLSNHVGIDLSTASIFMNYTDERDSLALKFAAHIPSLIVPNALIASSGHMKEIQDFNPNTIPYDGWFDQDKVCDYVMTCLEDCVRKAISSQGSAFVDWLCPSLTNLGSLKVQSIGPRCVQAIMELLLDPKCHVSTVVHTAHFLRDHFAVFKGPILSKVTEGLVKKGVWTTFSYVMTVFEHLTRNSFLKQNAHYIVPELILLCVRNKSKTALDDLAKLWRSGSKTRYLIVENLQYIFPYIVNHSSSTEYAECVQLIEDETKVKLSQLLPSHRQNVITELLRSFHSHNKKVILACQWMAQNDKNFKFNGKPTKDELAQYLQPRMLGVLGYFDQKLLNVHVSNDQKLDLLRSLHDLVDFLGKDNVAKVKHKVISSLQTGFAAKIPGSVPILVQTWIKLSKSLDSNALGPVLASIFAMTLVFYDMGFTDILEMYKSLIFKEGENLKDWCHQLTFLPDYEAFQEVNGAIRSHLKINENTPFKVVIKSVFKCLDNENVDVKLLTLRKLKNLIETNTDLLHGLIVGSNKADPVIGDLLHRVLVATRDSDANVVSLAGQVLGQIGAVDAGRLQVTQNLTKHAPKDIALYVTDIEFVRELIRNLVRAYLNATDSNDSEKSSYSLQEIVKEFKIHGNSSTGDGRAIWDLLTDEEREVIKPFMTSLYTVVGKPCSFPIPIYKTNAGNTYHKWLANWCYHLFSQVVEKRAKMVFTSCKPTLRTDLQLAQFIVPHVIVNIVTTGKSEDVEDIIKEITFILNDQHIHQGGEGKGLERLSTQTVFSILDHLIRWQAKRYTILMANKRKSDTAKKVKSKDPEYMAISAFLESISHQAISEAAFRHKAFERSVKHLELHLKINPNEFSANIHRIQQIYGALGEDDFLKGIAQVRTSEPSLEERIFELESTGHFQDALACYEALGKRQLGDEAIKKGLVRCYLEIDQPHLASMLLKGLDSKMSRDPSFKQYQVQVAWQLGQWNDLDQLTDNGEKCVYNWDQGIGKLLSTIHKHDEKSFYEQLAFVQLQEIQPITAASMEQGAYYRAYEHLVKLHMLHEIESLARTLIFTENQSPPAENDIRKVFEALKRRSGFVQLSTKSLEPIFKLRRGLLDLSLKKLESNPKLKDLVAKYLGETWLLAANVSRKSGQLNKAFNLLIETERYPLVDHFLEQSKLAWDRNRREEAISILKKGIPAMFPCYKPGMNIKQLDCDAHEKDVLGEAKLLLARFTDEAANLETESVPLLYQEAKNADPTNEDVYFYLAKFFDKQIGKNYKIEELERVVTPVTNAIGFYCRSLVIHGSKHVHLALPRLLTLWFDLGTRLHNLEKEKNPSSQTLILLRKQFSKATDFVRNWSQKVPKYFLFVNFPTMTSRLCHAHPEVWGVLKDILVRTFMEYPDQVFWHMVALCNSSFPARRERCKQIFEMVISQRKDLQKFLQDALDLTKTLNKLIELPASEQGEVSMEEVLPELPKLLAKPGFSNIMIPNLKQMSVVLPSVEVNRDRHAPFLGGKVGFYRFKDKVSIMFSKIKPKKISLVGTDGKIYGFLCKPKDDLRKDGRLLDFCYLLNELLSKDTECRKRNLRIRTYKVTPLDETNGIIEWVDNLMPFRTVMAKIYLEDRGVKPINRDDIAKYGAVKDDFENNKNKFEILLKRHQPPVFADWFIYNFPDPQTWFLARLRYIRTAAVMSMVGYILGLGDRHNENLLIDSSNGDIVHVDLNCIFEEATDLRVPEIVPFRLTQNMVHAMGPCGHAGPFQIACEASLKLMRDQKDVLMSALRPFYFDPLVEWASRRERGGAPGQSKVQEEIVNQRAVEVLNAIEERLRGIVAKMTSRSQSKTFKQPLSVSGQVNFLIKEATSETNLAQMYIGWSGFI